MTAPAVKLPAKQERAIAALVSEPTIIKAAQAAGVGERTLHRWLEEPRFAAAYRKARREAFGHAIGLVQRYAPVAVNALARVVADMNAPPASRVSAAVAVLKFARESIELDDLAARVDALEASVSQDKKP